MISYGLPSPDASGWQANRPNDPTSAQPPLNAYAVLAPIFGILVPPAGVVFGHLALGQLKRTGQRGWLAAVCGLVIGYLMCVLLVAVLAWSGGVRSNSTEPGAAPTSVPVITPPPTVITSLAPAPTRPRSKLALDQAAVGQCVEIQQRDNSGDDALDLFKVPCEHRDGVYTVVARVSAESECSSTYIAAPPNRAFAVCLNKY